jgi:Flp pilus assembly protein CpaB
MTIIWTPQARAALPLVAVAAIGLVCLLVLAGWLAVDRWTDRQIAQMGEAIRQAERLRQELESEVGQ